jgi:mono/diheme cytochrome c family protein
MANVETKETKAKGLVGGLTLIAAWLAMVLAGCGGAPGGDQSVSGVAATGTQANGTVSLLDSSNAPARTGAVDASGHFTVDVGGLESPFALKARWTDSATGASLKGTVTTGSSIGGLVTVSDSSSPARTARCTIQPDGTFTADVSGMTAPLSVQARFREHKRRGGDSGDDGAGGGTGSGSADAAKGATIYAASCASCHGALASSEVKGATAREINSAIGENEGGMGKLSGLSAADVANVAAALAGSTTPLPTPVTCTSFTYDAWTPAVCPSSGQQARTVATSTPAGCTGGSPLVTQPCTYVPPPPATCTSFTYNTWTPAVCPASGQQTRTVATSSPTGCTGGSPLVTQSCTYVPPIDGAALYTQYCSRCHGNGKKGRPASAIQTAINDNTGGMGTPALRALTPEQIAAISAAP